MSLFCRNNENTCSRFYDITPTCSSLTARGSRLLSTLWWRFYLSLSEYGNFLCELFFWYKYFFFKFTFYLTPDLFTHPNHSRLIWAAQNSQLWQRQSSQMSLNPQMHVFGFLCSFFMKCWIKEMYLEHVCNTMQKLFLHALYMNVWLKLMILIIKDRQYHYENTNSETSWLNLIKNFLQIPIEVYFFSIICIFPLPSRSLYKQHEGREKNLFLHVVIMNCVKDEAWTDFDFKMIFQHFFFFTRFLISF